MTAEQGNVEAQSGYADCLPNWLDVEINDVEAELWFRRSAKDEGSLVGKIMGGAGSCAKGSGPDSRSWPIGLPEDVESDGPGQTQSQISAE
jgi:TPR repeat protein